MTLGRKIIFHMRLAECTLALQCATRIKITIRVSRTSLIACSLPEACGDILKHFPPWLEYQIELVTAESVISIVGSRT